jgi:hypothetical protein
VAVELNRLLEGRTVFSDAWSVDNPWIISLFAAARVKRAFSVSALEMLLSEEQIALWPEMRDAVVSELGLTRHRASNDAWIIQETFARTLAKTTGRARPE